MDVPLSWSLHVEEENLNAMEAPPWGASCPQGLEHLSVVLASVTVVRS